MIEIKVYLYDSSKADYRGEDFSSYVLQGCENSENVKQELDISEITLQGIPRKVAFLPSTKFIIDIVDNGVIAETLHRMVQSDMCEQVILGDDTYYKHSLTLTEPSVTAQQRNTDNIACTYKLKDVTLATQTTLPTDTPLPVENKNGKWIPNTVFGKKIVSKPFKQPVYTYRIGKYLAYENNKLSIVGAGSLNSKKKYIKASDFTTGKAYFELPKLLVYTGIENTNTFANNGETASIEYKVTEYSADGKPTGYSKDGIIYSRSNFSNVYQGVLPKIPTSTMALPENAIFKDYRQGTFAIGEWKQYSVPDGSKPEPVYQTLPFDIKENRLYKLEIKPFLFRDFNAGSEDNTYKGENIAREIIVEGSVENIVDGRPSFGKTRSINVSYLSPETYKLTASFQTYATAEITETFSSGVPYTAKHLLEKAIMNTVVAEKLPEIGSADINYKANDTYAYNCPYYIDPAFVGELDKTQVIENFYNEKNLWEIMLEVGNYIHAIPEIKFGENDKFMITFNRLGETEENTTINPLVSVMNFRGLDDYICATNSYVDNMVQLGGYIDEWVAPKNSAENYLTYNDTAQIKGSKEIIELLGFQIKCNSKSYTSIGIHEGDVTAESGDSPHNALTYVFEKNIYKLLSENVADVPNKGIALYYNLSSNAIEGGQYQLPQENTTAYSDYAIKKVIYCAFNGSYPSNLVGAKGPWANISVNDFTFRLVYRTKSTIRQTHTRPDLRKYIMNSKWDITPIHEQFYNQQDKIIDSEKYGRNMYGTLIKTGNLSYERNEWAESVSQLKKKGQLVRIDDDIYYVANVDNTYYADHIESVVKYSKDYNELSKVVGIPSEPRFYEISEQNIISREVAIKDYLLLTTDKNKLADKSGFLEDMAHLKQLICGSDKPVEFAKYVVTTFKGDKDIGIDEGTFGESDFYKDIFSPVNAFSSATTLTYEWDMVDNYSAGDRVTAVKSTEHGGKYVEDNKYSSLEAVRYTDKHGKATLFDFYLLKNLSSPLTFEEIKNIPLSPFTTKIPESNEEKYIGYESILATNVKSTDTEYNNRGLVLLKDCREKLSFNYNLQAITDSDTFITSSSFYTPKSKPDGSVAEVSLVALNTEVNKLSNGYIPVSHIINKDLQGKWKWVEVKGQGTFMGNVTSSFYLDLSAITETDLEGVKALALVIKTDGDYLQFSVAKNLPSTFTVSQKKANWYFGKPDKTKLFKIQ